MLSTNLPANIINAAKKASVPQDDDYYLFPEML